MTREEANPFPVMRTKGLQSPAVATLKLPKTFTVRWTWSHAFLLSIMLSFLVPDLL